jgi:uncharacterized protein
LASVIFVDTNVLIYAHNENSIHHTAIAQWIEKVLLKEDVIGLPWVSVWGFLRVSTNSRIWPNPKSSAEVFSILEDWFSLPGVALINPGPRHAALLERLMDEHQVSGPLVSDAVLAALAMEKWRDSRLH